MAPQDAIFRETAPGVYTRLCYLSEAMMAWSSETGFGQTTYSGSVMLAQPLSKAALSDALRRAVIQLRSLVPMMACRTTEVSTRKYQFQYTVLKSAEEEKEWLDQIVIFGDARPSARACHDRLAGERWWKAGEGRFVHEVHAAPIGDSDLDLPTASWSISLTAHHCAIDGQSGFMVLDKLLTFLRDELEGLNKPFSSIKWGEETRRLPMAADVVWSVAKTGQPDEIAKPDLPSPVPEGEIPWMMPIIHSDPREVTVTAYSQMMLSKEETNRFQAACKAHGRTITQVATAISNLVLTEALLRVAGSRSSDLFEEVRSTLQSSTRFMTNTNTVNMRQFFPDEYKDFGEDKSTPLCALNGAPLTFPLEPYRRSVVVNESKRTATRNVDKELFWEVIVRDVALAWSKADLSVDAFRASFSFLDQLLETGPDAAQFVNGSPCHNSLGDMTRLGLFEDFRPSTDKKILTLNELEFSIRISAPSVNTYFVQYDGRFRVDMACGWIATTQEEMNLRARIWKEWFDALF